GVVEQDDDGIGVLEVLGPLVLGVNDGVGVGIVGVDGARQVDGGGEEFVIAAAAVRSGIGDEDDLLDVLGFFLSLVIEDIAFLLVFGAGGCSKQEAGDERGKRWPAGAGKQSEHDESPFTRGATQY